MKEESTIEAPHPLVGGREDGLPYTNTVIQENAAKVRCEDRKEGT